MIDMAQKRLLMYRVDAGFNSQQELAEAAGLHLSTINAAETGGHQLSWKSKRKIVNALKARGLQVEVEDIDWGTK